MSQPNSSSSTSAHASPSAAKPGASRKYLLFFAVLVLIAVIFYFFTKNKPGAEFPSSEPTVTPAVTQGVASSASSLKTVYADKQVGECFEFGRYPQEANGEIKPITWQIIQCEKDYLLVIAEHGLDSKPYHDKRSCPSCPNIWSDCTLRSWLNSEFMTEAFNEQERECILKTNVVNNAGPNTEDYVFSLSVDEARSLFANDVERRVKPTEYAVANGVVNGDNGYCIWWLRSHGRYDDDAAYVRSDGAVHDSGGHLDTKDFAVRPAIKLAL